jgi:purine-cytosine permease-like protein
MSQPTTSQPATVIKEPPPALSIEHRGVDTVPLKERHYGPWHIFAILYGSNLTYSIIIFGSFPILFGLSWWASVTAIVAGTTLGAAFLAPMALFGAKTGTNNAVSSGAHFGVAGRFIGTALALFSALGFTAITIWTSGDALVAGVARLFGTGVSDLGQALGYAVIAVVVVAICMRGIHLMLRLQERIMTPLMTVVLLVGVFAFAPEFDAGYAGGELAFGSFAATWIASALLTASVIVSYGPFVGDWTRYVHPDQHTPGRLATATFLGAFLGMGLPFLWGAFVTSTFAGDAGDFIGGLVANSPGWYVVALVGIGLVAGVSQGTIGLYGTGLDTSSLVPRLSRRQSTILIASIVIVLVYGGAFVWDVIPVINAFIVVLLVVTSPWIVIMTIGYFHRRAHYLPDDLQVFTRGERGGRYWFHHGWNWRAVCSWALASVLGLLFAVAEPIFTGPWAGAADGVDLSFGLASVVAAVLYLAALRIWPEPSSVMPGAADEVPDHTGSPAAAVPVVAGD